MSAYSFVLMRMIWFALKATVHRSGLFDHRGRSQLFPTAPIRHSSSVFSLW